MCVVLHTDPWRRRKIHFSCSYVDGRGNRGKECERERERDCRGNHFGMKIMIFHTIRSPKNTLYNFFRVAFFSSQKIIEFCVPFVCLRSVGGAFVVQLLLNVDGWMANCFNYINSLLAQLASCRGKITQLRNRSQMMQKINFRPNDDDLLGWLRWGVGLIDVGWIIKAVVFAL